jgi:cbb3-type cytochrome oxidase maturation protein
VSSFYFIIPIAIVFCALAIGAFFWAIDHGQFDDLESEGKRILFDDDPELPSPTVATQQTSTKTSDHD